MKLNEIYEVASRVKSYPFLSNASVIAVDEDLELIPQTVFFVGENLDLQLTVPAEVINGSSFAIVSNKTSKFLLKIQPDSGSKIVLPGGEEMAEAVFSEGIYTVVFMYREDNNSWNLLGEAGQELFCGDVISNNSLSLSRNSAFTQSLNVVGEKTVLVKAGFVGNVINAGDENSILLLKDFETAEEICELSKFTNVRATFIYYDTNQNKWVTVYTGIFSTYSDLENKPLSLYNGATLQAEQVREIYFEDGLFSIVSDGNKANISFNNTAFLDANTSALSGNISLNENSAFYQRLSPNGQNRDIIVHSGWTGTIINNSDGIFALRVISATTTDLIEELSAATGIRAIKLWFDSEEPISLQESSYSYENFSFTGFKTTSIKSADYTAKNGERILCDTSAGGFKIITPTYGRFQVVDASSNAISENDGFGSNSLVVETPLGSDDKIVGKESLILNRGLVSAEFEYISSQKDWKLLNPIEPPVKTFSIVGEIVSPIQGLSKILIARDEKNLRIKSISGFTSQGLCTISIKKREQTALSSLSYLNFSDSNSKYTNTSQSSLENLSLEDDYYTIVIVSQIASANFSYTIWLESF